MVASLNNFSPSKCINKRLDNPITDSFFVPLPNKIANNSWFDRWLDPYCSSLSLGLSVLGTSFIFMISCNIHMNSFFLSIIACFTKGGECAKKNFHQRFSYKKPILIWIRQFSMQTRGKFSIKTANYYNFILT